jgi:hypothetical protein
MLYLIPLYAEQTTNAIDLCLRNRLVLPALTLLYSGIDVLGFLATDKPGATRRSFIAWAEKYMDGLLKIKGIVGMDLYSARCGVLHTGQAPSNLVHAGKARELWYRFDGESHINLMANTPKVPVLIDVEELVESFKSGTKRFANDLDTNPAMKTNAESRADRFFRRGLLSGPR